MSETEAFSAEEIISSQRNLLLELLIEIPVRIPVLVGHGTDYFHLCSPVEPCEQILRGIQLIKGQSPDLNVKSHGSVINNGEDIVWSGLILRDAVKNERQAAFLIKDQRNPADVLPHLINAVVDDIADRAVLSAPFAE